MLWKIRPGATKGDDSKPVIATLSKRILTQGWAPRHKYSTNQDFATV
jgi:hypothetical protein